MKERLIKLLDNCYAPLSKFTVSSILITRDGREFEGVNVEDGSATRTGVCAERNAVFAAFTAGYKKGDFKEIYIMAGETDKLITPCFVCRQIIVSFFDDDTKVITMNKKGESKVYTKADLCPHIYSSEDWN